MYCTTWSIWATLIPSVKMLVTLGWPFESFTMVARKSMVLASVGFHLNDSGHVILVFGPAASPPASPPTGASAGVKMMPSVMYSNPLESICDMSVPQHWKMLWSCPVYLNFLHSMRTGHVAALRTTERAFNPLIASNNSGRRYLVTDTSAEGGTKCSARTSLPAM